MKVLIAEKPSAAEKIAKSIGKAVKKDSYYELTVNNEEWIVIPAAGHLLGLEQIKGESKEYYPVFDVEWKADSTKNKFLKPFKDYLSKADEVVNACDFDVEGSLIGFNLIRAYAKKDAIKKRMKYSTLTEEELQNAFANREELDYSQSYAGEARHFLDWLYGINLSRALMSAVKKAGRFKILSMGRVQGPMLKILDEKEEEINKFVSIPYWELKGTSKEVLFEYKGNPITGEVSKANKILNELKAEATVKEVSTRESEVRPLPPFDLTSLQIEAYGALGFSPSQTLQLAQSLYEKAVISYPRTSSQKLPLKLNFKNIFTKLQRQEEYAEYCKTALKGKMIPVEGKKEDPAHPAIHPTGEAVPLNTMEKKLYDLIVRRFIACFYPDAKKLSMKIILDNAGHEFQANGYTYTDKAWINVYTYYNSKETTFPEFKQDEKVRFLKEILAKMTQPPKRYSPASLIKKMEDLDLGTKATRASILQSLYSRGYVEGRDSLAATEFGSAVVKALEKDCPKILSEELTRQIELDMDAITDNKKTKEQVIDDGKKILLEVLTELKSKELELGNHLIEGLQKTMIAASVLGACRECQKNNRDGMLVIKTSRFGQFAACNKYPDCKQTFSLPKQALIKPLLKQCEKCNSPMITVIRKGKRPFNMCLDPKCETKANWGIRKAAKAAKLAAAGTVPSTTEQPITGETPTVTPAPKTPKVKRIRKPKTEKPNPEIN